MITITWPIYFFLTDLSEIKIYANLARIIAYYFIQPWLRLVVH